METKYKRFFESEIRDILREIPAVSITGLKGVGKTETAKVFAEEIYELDSAKDKEVINADVSVIAKGPFPVLIDEWQKAAKTWDFARRDIDRDYSAGRYIFTGSISAKDIDTHSGAGRILAMRMFPLSFQERGIEEAKIFLDDILEKRTRRKMIYDTDIGIKDYVREIVISGLPAIRKLSKRNRSRMIDSYIDNLLTHDFVSEGIVVKQPNVLKAWLRAYSAAIGTMTGYTEILDASTSGMAEKPNKKLTIAFRETLAKLWLLEEVPAWELGYRYHSRLKKTPKHFLADTAFATSLLGLSEETLLGTSSKNNLQTRFDNEKGGILGRLFEGLVFQSLLAYAGVLDAEVSYFRTGDSSREIDFVLTKGMNTVAVEVKLAEDISGEDVRHLLWLKKEMGNLLTDMVIITTGKVSYRRKDGVLVVPLALLGGKKL